MQSVGQLALGLLARSEGGGERRAASGELTTRPPPPPRRVLLECDDASSRSVGNTNQGPSNINPILMPHTLCTMQDGGVGQHRGARPVGAGSRRSSCRAGRNWQPAAIPNNPSARNGRAPGCLLPVLLSAHRGSTDAMDGDQGQGGGRRGRDNPIVSASRSDRGTCSSCRSRTRPRKMRQYAVLNPNV